MQGSLCRVLSRVERLVGANRWSTSSECLALIEPPANTYNSAHYFQAERLKNPSDCDIKVSFIAM
jgi:hypothetical protein